MSHLSYSSCMELDGLDASLDLWMGTFTGKEVASKKSVTRFLLIMSEWMGRNSGREEDKDDLLLEELEFGMDIVDPEDILVVVKLLIGRSKKSNIVTVMVPCYVGRPG